MVQVLASGCGGKEVEPIMKAFDFLVHVVSTITYGPNSYVMTKTTRSWIEVSVLSFLKRASVLKYGDQFDTLNLRLFGGFDHDDLCSPQL